MNKRRILADKLQNMPSVLYIFLVYSYNVTTSDADRIYLE